MIAGAMNAFGQDLQPLKLPVIEGFETQSSKQLENGPLPYSWSQLYIGNNKPQSLNWKIQAGGGFVAGNENITKPDSTHSGKYNATLWLTSLTPHNMYLISPLIDFKKASKPTLTFWYSQYSDRASSTDLSEIDNYEITVGYFIGNEWHPIRDYTMPTDDAEPWRMSDSILLEDVIGRDDVQIAFLGKTKVLGHGCCIDDIKIEERDAINKYVDESSFTATQSSDIIPTNSADNVILQLRVEAHGNNNQLFLNSLTATALQDAAIVGDENPISSVKLYYTETETFKSNNLLCTTTIDNGKATFNNIGFDLLPGYNYLWVTCDIKEDVNHEFRNDTIDLKIEPGAINIGGGTYPTSALDPSGKRLVSEAIFIEDFENESSFDINWPTRTGDFEIDTPVESENYEGTGNPDPSHAHGGQWMLGTNIGGENGGTYSREFSSYAESKSFDCTNFKDVSLIFYRYLNLGSGDKATICVSVDGGEWQEVWESHTIIANKNWNYQNISLKNIADHKSNVRIRFGIAPGNSTSLRYSGWNIDDVALVGTFVKYDATITEIISPRSGCDLSENEVVKIKIKNIGHSDIENNRVFKTGYSIDGGNTWIEEPITGGLAKDAEREISLSTPTDLHEYGLHNFRTRVTLTKESGVNIDDNPENNEVQERIMSLPYYTMPYSENFNIDGGYWYSDNDTWQNTKPKNATSRYWATKIVRGYNDRYVPNNTDALESPCFDMRNIQKPILEFKLKGDVAETDGLALYYSTNGGTTWSLMGEYDFGDHYKHACWNWYNTTDDNIDALGTIGWGGKFDWTRIMQLMPDDVAGKQSVRLKFVFSAGDDDDEDHDGFAIDDIRIYESPIDAGVVAIKPESDCHLLEEQPITISIKNFGNRAITPNDSLFASVTINDKITLVDTFFVTENLAVGSSQDFTFDQKVNMWYKKAYKMDATTMVKYDTLLFNNTVNDAKTATATVLGEPQYDLGADIGTTDPEHFSPKPNGGAKSDGSDFNIYNWYWYAFGKPKTDDFKTQSSGKLLSGARPFNTAQEEKEYYCYIDVTVISAGKTCTETDSIKIINSHYDVGIINNGTVAKTDPSDPASGYTFTPLDDAFCSNTIFNNIGVEVKNFHNQVETDEDFTISICYQMPNADGDIITYAEDTILNEAPFEANSSFVYIFKRQPSFEFGGEQTIKFFTKIKYKADLNYENDAQSKVVTIWPTPIADIKMDGVAYDSILISTPVDKILTTKAIANATYTWQNVASGVVLDNTFTIKSNKTQEYIVTVKDEHSCATVTDNVWVVTDNWKLVELVSPTNNCDPQSNLDITVSIKNDSPNKYLGGANGYKIPASVTFNGNKYYELITLPENELGEYDEFEYTFTSIKVDMPEVGVYNLDVKINPEHDINRDDNTINSDIDIWGTPRLDIGPDTIFTLRPDTISLSAGPEFIKRRWFDNGIGDTQLDLENPECFTPTSNICWVYAQNEHGCYADDQKIRVGSNNYYASDTVRIVKTDIGIERIETPITACDIESFNTVKIRLTNSGIDDVESNNVTLPFMVKINDNTPIRKEYALQSDFYQGTSLSVAIPFDFNFDKNETYDFAVWLDWDIDRFHQNDTARTTVSQYPNPDPFTLGDDIYTTSPDTVVLHAPENYYNYSWSGGQSNSDILAVSYIGTRTYGVRVSNQYGCSYSDSLVVSLTNPEIEITGLDFSTDVCESESLSNISFTLKNIGEDIIAKGSQIDIEYSIDGGTLVSEIFKVGRTLISGESVAITFKHQADFRNAASYALNIKASIADTVAVSTKDFTVTVHESPNVSLGNDIRTFEQSVTLNAGSGFSSYLWNTGATSEKIEVTTDGEYWVTAANTYGCKNTDTINVRLIPATITVFELNSPKSACSLKNEPIKISIVNNGTTKIEKGNTISVKCIFDNDSSFTISNTLPFDLEQKGQLESNMGSISNNKPGQHILAFVISIEGAVIDSSAFEFEIYGTPEFDFESETIEVDSYPYTLTTSSSLSNVTYLWDTNTTSNAIEVNADGTHTLTVTDNHKCSASKSVTVKKKTTGVGNSTISDITVYPNPANNIVNIDFDGMMTNGCQILIANASGRIIFASKQTSDIMQIAVDDWAQGIYFIKITNKNESRIVKFVKE